MLAGGFALVLALTIALVHLTRSASPPVAGKPPATTSAPAPAPAPEPTVRGSDRPSTAPEPPRVAAAPRPRAASSSARPPELGLERPSFRRELKRDDNGHLVPMIPLQELRAQLPLMEAPMKACIERSRARPTGKATLSFIVAAKDQKLVIETTGVQDDETLAAYPDLLKCMHEAAHALVLEGRAVPELGTAMYVRRHIRLDNGELVESSMPDFSYSP